MGFLYTFNGVNVINYFSIYGYRFCYNKIISKMYLNISLFFIYYLSCANGMKEEEEKFYREA